MVQLKQMDKLQLFYTDYITRDLVRQWIEQCADEWVVSELRNGKTGIGYADAIKIIDNSFTKLDEKFGQVKKANKDNQAR